ncbi:hypothetical protein T07_7093 [Trichinella nelsoni]|uniref:Uncharacterized protein n=1 Tax=Trichinella nelsoni TaxID=6336 RepID=A0A0V0RSD3_9BILA|nr:hypothetical protein T07_7093 [Trichinella nelsoni]
MSSVETSVRSYSTGGCLARLCTLARYRLDMQVVQPPVLQYSAVTMMRILVTFEYSNSNLRHAEAGFD